MLGLPGSVDVGGFSSATPSRGANSTATNHDTNSVIVDHGEDREGVFARRALREADRHEPGRGDEGPGQHRKSQGLVGEGRRLLGAVALGDARGH